jgi:hypothetical protein
MSADKHGILYSYASIKVLRSSTKIISSCFHS